MARRPGGDVAIRSRLAASPGLNDAEAHTLAGLLDAESSFFSSQRLCSAVRRVSTRPGAQVRRRSQRRSSRSARLMNAWSKGRGGHWQRRAPIALHPRRYASIAARQPHARRSCKYSRNGRIRSMGASRAGRMRLRGAIYIRIGRPVTRSRRRSVHGTTRSAQRASRLGRLGETRLPRVKLERLQGRETAGYRAAVIRRLRGLLDCA
jgi:hypothetical protein